MSVLKGDYESTNNLQTYQRRGSVAPVDVKFLEIVRYSAHHHAAQRAINNAVIVGVRQQHFMPYGNGITALCFNHSGFFLNSAQCENSHLRLQDNRCAHYIAE